MSLRRVVVVTGCDSGLGWALAARAARSGLVTVAGMRSGLGSEAQRHLAAYKAHTLPLDVTDGESVERLKEYVKQLLKDNPDYRLYALINNAGVMTVGDFEWQTPRMLEAQVAVNLLGAMRVAGALLPDLRRAAIEGAVRPRLINVASHCGVQPLPGFAAYSATKGALLAWTEALRLELRASGVRAVAFIPGGFVLSSKIMSRQTQEVDEMARCLDAEQLSYYGTRLKAIKSYLSFSDKPPRYFALKDENLIELLMTAVNAKTPKPLYKNEPWRYKIYFALFRLPLPEFLRSWLVNRFVCFPSEK